MTEHNITTLSSSSSSSSSSLSHESIFFTNLLLLGFNVDNYEREYRISFHRDMFKSSNVRAMELITHFLMGKLEGDKKRNQMLKGCWPVVGKNERNEFRRIVGEWLKTVLNRNIQRTMLMTCYGENFVQLLHDLSHHVLLHNLKQRYPEYVNRHVPMTAVQCMDSIALLESYSNADAADQLRCLTNSLMLHVRQQSQQLLDNTSRFVAQRHQWKQSADKVTLELNTLAQRNAQLHEKLHTMNQLSQERRTEQASHEQEVKRALDMMKALHDKYRTIRDVQDEMCDTSISKQHASSSSSSSTATATATTTTTTHAMKNAQQQTRNLPHILNRYNQGMKRLIMQTNQQPESKSLLANLDTMSQFSQDQKRSYDGYLQNLQNFETEIKQVAGDMEKRIDHLHSEIQENDPSVLQCLNKASQQPQQSYGTSSATISTPRSGAPSSSSILAPNFSLMLPTPPKPPLNVMMDSPAQPSSLRMATNTRTTTAAAHTHVTNTRLPSSSSSSSSSSPFPSTPNKNEQEQQFKMPQQPASAFKTPMHHQHHHQSHVMFSPTTRATVTTAAATTTSATTEAMQSSPSSKHLTFYR